MRFFTFSITLMSLSLTTFCNAENNEIKSIEEVLKETEALRTENDRLRNWFDDVTKNITELQGNIFISTSILNVFMFTMAIYLLNVISDSHIDYFFLFQK